MSSDDKRYARQMKLAGVGREIQQNLRHASVRVEGDDLAARVEALYLAGAGIGNVSVASSLVEDVVALNSDVRIAPLASGTVAAASLDPRALALDPAAARVATGALRALAQFKARTKAAVSR